MARCTAGFSLTPHSCCLSVGQFQLLNRNVEKVALSTDPRKSEFICFFVFVLQSGVVPRSEVKPVNRFTNNL